MSGEIVPFSPVQLATKKIRPPALFLSGPQASKRFWEFFTANIRNPNTRRAYFKAAIQFSEWCEAKGLFDLADVQPVHVAAYVEKLQRRIAAPSVKLQLAGIRMLFDWLVVGQAVPMNPASAVRGPKHSVKKGKTPVLTAEEARALLESIDTSSVVGLRDRALIALMTYTFARVGAGPEASGDHNDSIRAVPFLVEEIWATWTSTNSARWARRPQGPPRFLRGAGGSGKRIGVPSPAVWLVPLTR